MINDRTAWIFAVIVRAGDVHEIIKPEMFFGIAADFNNFFRVGNLDGDFTAKFRRFGDEITEFSFDFIGGFESGHGFKFF